MRLVILMGGTGRRFQEAGYAVPKPLLQLGTKRLVQWAISSFPTEETDLFEYLVAQPIAVHPALHECGLVGCWHVLERPTRGPLQTCLMAPGCLETSEELLICDCDSIINQEELRAAIQTFRQRNAMGGVTVRHTTDPLCSFADLDPEWWVRETREKDPFTSWSTTGPYWFRSGEAFWQAAQQAASAGQVSISPVYNYLAGRTAAVPVETFHHLGTPESFELFRRELNTLP